MTTVGMAWALTPCLADNSVAYRGRPLEGSNARSDCSYLAPLGAHPPSSQACTFSYEYYIAIGRMENIRCAGGESADTLH